MAEYKFWQRTISASGGKVKLAAVLVKSDSTETGRSTVPSPDPVGEAVKAPRVPRSEPQSDNQQQSAPRNERDGEFEILNSVPTDLKNVPPITPSRSASISRASNVDTRVKLKISSLQPNAEASIGAQSDEKPRVRHDGIKIAIVVPGGPADQAGLEVGDYILALDGHYFFTVEDLNAEIRSHAPGSRVPLRYRRYATIYDTYVVLGTASH